MYAMHKPKTANQKSIGKKNIACGSVACVTCLLCVFGLLLCCSVCCFL
jgi:hypothetical protein